MNPVQYRWCLYTVCVCALMHIWFVPALGGVHLVWHALSDWLHSDAVLGVSLSLHITYTHRHTHHTSNWIIITGLSKVSTCFSSFFLHVIIMDCVRIPWVHLGFFTLEASAFLAFSDIHFFTANQLAAGVAVHWPFRLIPPFTSIQNVDLSNVRFVQCT